MHQAVETELSKRNILPTDVQKRKQEMNAGKYSTEADSYNYRRIEAQFGTGHPQAQLSYGCFNGPASNLVFSRILLIWAHIPVAGRKYERPLFLFVDRCLEEWR